MKKLISEDGENGPSFDLPLENELLILKLKAEFGAECSSGDESLPPDVVNDFLKSVYEFEKKFREERKLITVSEKLGRPLFAKADSIPEKFIGAELRKTIDLLNANCIHLDVLGDYPERQIYRFITEEFLYHEMDHLDIKGYMHHFCYEDFHPNYELEIRQRSTEFITQWFNRMINEYSWQLADPFVHPDSRELRKEDVLKKIQNVFAAFIKFSDCNYSIGDLTYEWDDMKQKGSAYVKGMVNFNAHTEDGEVIPYDGPFEFYLSNSGAWWSIFYLVFPGFSWG